jgi:Calcineurin-like phosphoesterase
MTPSLTVLTLLIASLAATTFAFVMPSSTRLASTHDESTLLNAVQYKDVNYADSWNLVVLGDLHMEDDMMSHHLARDDCIQAITDLSLRPSSQLFDVNSLPSVETLVKSWRECKAGELSASQLKVLMDYMQHGNLLNCNLVSLGDLGRKDIRHEQGDAGTTLSFQEAKDFFDGFNLPYDLVTGNHDLEGLDEFKTDSENLQAWMKMFDKNTPYFQRYIGEKTLLLGLSTVKFREAQFSSHEVQVDDAQVDWFVRTVESHPESEGWKIIVFSHAPIMGSNLRVLQSVHVINGCAWLNHSSENRNIFIQTVRKNPQIKAWCSGHFHLSHDYQDAISMVGSCAFVQVGVMGPVSTRDGRRQTRLIRGCPEQMQIYTIQHHLREDDQPAPVRLDMTMDLKTGQYTFAHGDQEVDRDDWFQAYTPQQEDG